MSEVQERFARLIASRKVVVCVGSGGVGKTTCSAVIALHEAIRGRKVLVLTIDPAKRLANSLGVDEIGNDLHRIPIERFAEIGVEPRGELWAMMLDMKESFDHVVTRHAPPEQAREILNNRIYQFFSTSLAGTQEYAAAERLYELYEEGNFDLIVLDTPPTTHALDFLDAPKRLSAAVDNKALQWLYKPSALAGRKGLGIFSMGTSYVMKTLAKFTGAQLLDEFATFLKNFSVLFDGLKSRGEAVRKVLLSDASTFVVVTAPAPLTIDEALYMNRKLNREQVTVGAFVVNRVYDFGFDPAELRRPAVSFSTSLDLPSLTPDQRRDVADRLLANAQEFALLASVDTESIGRLTRETTDVPVCPIPYFATDIHSLSGLNQARLTLFSDRIAS